MSTAESTGLSLDSRAVYRGPALIISVRMQIAVIFLFLILLGIKIWVKISLVSLGYEMARVKSEAVELDLRRQELELRYSFLTRPDTLSEMAGKRLGLKPLDSSKAKKIFY